MWLGYPWKVPVLSPAEHHQGQGSHNELLRTKKLQQCELNIHSRGLDKLRCGCIRAKYGHIHGRPARQVPVPAPGATTSGTLSSVDAWGGSCKGPRSLCPAGMVRTQ